VNVAAAFVASVLSLLAPLALAQSDVFNTQSGTRGPPAGDSFNTQGKRGSPCDTDVWTRSHGGRWDRCAYERDCPGPDTLRYGAPDRFPATDSQRMRGYARCAVDPCTPGGAQCWGRLPSDDIRTQAKPPAGKGAPAGNGGSGAGQPNPSGRKSITRVPGEPPRGGGGDPDAMVAAIGDCLRVKGELAWYVDPPVVAGTGPARYDPARATVVYDRNGLRAQPPWLRAYYLADAFGAHAVAQNARRTMMPPSPQAQRKERDYLIGYVAHCLRDAGLLPPATGQNDPRLQFTDYIYVSGGKVPLTPAAEKRVGDFTRGVFDYGMPILLNPR